MNQIEPNVETDHESEYEKLQALGIDVELRPRLVQFWESGRIRLDIPVIDLQHIWLVYLILELDKECRLASVQALDQEKIKKINSELINYTTEHFSLEDDLLARYDFPEGPNHREQHVHFINFLDDRVNEIKNGNTNAVTSLVNFLMDWLTLHIQREDARYRDFFLRQKVDLREHFQSLIARRGVSIDKAQAALYSSVAGSTAVKEIVGENVIFEVIKIWNAQNLSVFIPIIDLQHIWLISLIVELDIAGRTMNSSRRAKIFNKVVQSALEYADEHFRTEEKIMVRFNYSKLTNHLKQHQGFTDFVNKRARDFQQGDTKAASGLVTDLKEWLVSHIAIEDRGIYMEYRNQLNDIQKYVREMINKGEIKVRKKHMDLYHKVSGLTRSD
ncbi:MAG: hemerythrin family protein [Spirochaetia bacterium]|nr:hemerythrin family protein [Spirochaetia bacterium]